MKLPVVVATVLAAGLSWGALAAQTGNWLTVGAGATGIRLQSRSATGVSSDVSGVVFGGAGSVAVGPVALELGYWQGRLDAGPGSTQLQDVIDGRALLVLRAVPWLGVKVGTEARSYVTPAGTERWVFWQARIRAERTIVDPSVRGHVEVWRALSTEVNAPQAVDHGQGGEVGLTLLRALGPLWVRLAYGIDDARLTGSARRQTVEALAFSVGYGGGR
ncbi:MAG TPA: hypothetical protein VF978_06785 [Gemmatimonadales bacterium]